MKIIARGLKRFFICLKESWLFQINLNDYSDTQRYYYERYGGYGSELRQERYKKYQELNKHAGKYHNEWGSQIDDCPYCGPKS